MTIFLCGFMGCGKSTAGRIAAKRLGFGYADTDELIVHKENMTIPEIFAEKGEPYFRKLEAETVKGLCGKNIIVACGGGAMLNNDTAEFAAKNGMILFLDVPFKICYGRIKNDKNRPIASSSTEEELHERYNYRYQIYLKNSSARVECTGSPNENADAIISAVKGYKHANLQR